MSVHFTVLGAGGRVGSALVAALRGAHPVRAIDRAGLAGFLAGREDAGHVINCIGLTGDFRARPLDTAESHVGVVARLLARRRFASLLVLSSTRVYTGAATTHEDTALSCHPGDPSDLYNLTKLAGEALCLSQTDPAIRVVRLSNVYAPSPDPDTFLGQILDEGRRTGGVLVRQGPGSEKDYVSLDRVVSVLPRIAAGGRHRLYNLAGGRNISHGAIAAVLRDTLGWRITFAADAPTVRFPPIEITRLNDEFRPALSDPLRDLSTIALGQEAPCSLSTKLAVA